MSDGDAEWIDVDKEFGGRLTPIPGPNNPRPRPTTVRPLKTTVKNEPEDANETVDPNSNNSSTATVISVSVISSMAIIGLIFVLFYLLVLKKKLKKVEKSKLDSEYCLRVEDVAHLDIDESASLYVNTTDLQKLVSTVRLKNKGRPPAIPNENSEVVRIEKPASNHGIQEEPRVNNDAPTVDHSYPETNNSITKPKIPPPTAPPVIQKFDEPGTVKVARAAPPPPNQDVLYSNQNLESEDSFDELDDSQNKVSLSNQKTKQQTKPQPPNSNSKPKFLHQAPQPEAPPVASKPKIVLNGTKKKSPPPVSLKPKPQLINPSLPLLKINLLPSMNRQDSGFSTPGTASTCLSDSSHEKALENGLDSEDEPTSMSVTARRARLEQALATESQRRS